MFVSINVGLHQVGLQQKEYSRYCTVAQRGHATFFFYHAINGKLVGSHSIGCHARCFRGRDDNGCNSWKVLSQSRNLQTYNVIRENR